MKDQRIGSGNIYKANRIVKKGGKVKFEGVYFQHEKLLAYVGRELTCLHGGPSCWVCETLFLYTSEYCSTNDLVVRIDL